MYEGNKNSKIAVRSTQKVAVSSTASANRCWTDLSTFYDCTDVDPGEDAPCTGVSNYECNMVGVVEQTAYPGNGSWRDTGKTAIFVHQLELEIAITRGYRGLTTVGTVPARSDIFVDIMIGYDDFYLPAYQGSKYFLECLPGSLFCIEGGKMKEAGIYPRYKHVLWRKTYRLKQGTKFATFISPFWYWSEDGSDVHDRVKIPFNRKVKYNSTGALAANIDENPLFCYAQVVSPQNTFDTGNGDSCGVTVGCRFTYNDLD